MLSKRRENHETTSHSLGSRATILLYHARRATEARTEVRGTSGGGRTRSPHRGRLALGIPIGGGGIGIGKPDGTPIGPEVMEAILRAVVEVVDSRREVRIIGHSHRVEIEANRHVVETN